MERVNSRTIEWGVAGRPLAGQKESGDLYLVQARPGKALVAVVDGLGHGEEAAAAAKLAIATLKNHSDEAPLPLVQRCCQALQATRGVVMSLAVFDASQGTVDWLGVGNVEGVLLRADGHAAPNEEVLLLRPGVVGDRQPRLTASVLMVSAGDLLIFATDGIRPDFAQRINLDDPPQRIADRILAEYGLETDDALVVVVRYVHGQEKTTDG
jgi:phosphoserine phosphatase RsbX